MKTITTIADYNDFMGKQKIYLNQMPVGTIKPDNVIFNSELGEIELKADINGPIVPDEYYMQSERIGIWLKESVIEEDNWNDTLNPDRGGHNKSLELKDLKYYDIKEDDTEFLYQNIVEFAFYLINYIESGINTELFFDGNEEVGMEVFKKHFAIQNACWFPHVGNKTDMPTIINWMIEYEAVHAQISKIFNPTLILGTGTIKPQWDARKNNAHAFGLEPLKTIFRDEIRDIVGYYISRKCDDAFIMSDGKLYINIYHPSSTTKFNAKKIARGVAILYNLHKEGKL